MSQTGQPDKVPEVVLCDQCRLHKHMDWRFGVGGAVFLHTVGHPPFVEGCHISEAPVDVVRMDMSLAFVDDFVHEVIGSCSDAGISEGSSFTPSATSVVATNGTPRTKEMASCRELREKR